MRRWVWVALFACYTSGHSAGAGPDAGQTGPGDGVSQSACVGTLVEYCFDGTEPGSTSLSGTLDTDSDQRCRPATSGVGACVIAGLDVQVGAGVLAAHGSRPLALIAQSITVPSGAVLDASGAPSDLVQGAGARTCVIPPTMMNGGGGAGGTFVVSGGSGGLSFDGQMQPSPAAASPVTTLAGGCPGYQGGDGTIAREGGGGGAIYLAASVQIAIGGTVRANGGGGAGGEIGAGGGGGGAGGMIVVDAPMHELTGSVFARGGGGGGGGGANPGSAGTTGGSGGGGGGGGGAGGDGGRGNVGAAGVGTPAGGATSDGGGGGGGSVGCIFVGGVGVGAGGATIDPPAQPLLTL